MSKSYVGPAIFLMLMNLTCVLLISISKYITQIFVELIPIFLFFLFLVVSFCAVCYLVWYTYVLSANALNAVGISIMGFILPVLTAFLATANWTAFSTVSGIALKSEHTYGFNDLSVTMVFILFFIGAVTWGVLIKNQEYETKHQSIIASDYTVLTYWLSFIVFCWLWLFWKLG